MRHMDASVTLYVNKNMRGETTKLLVFNQLALAYMSGWDYVEVSFSMATMTFRLVHNDVRGNRKVILQPRETSTNSRIYVTSFIPTVLNSKTHFDMLLHSASLITLTPSPGTRVFDASEGKLVELY